MQKNRASGLRRPGGGLGEDDGELVPHEAEQEAAAFSSLLRGITRPDEACPGPLDPVFSQALVRHRRPVRLGHPRNVHVRNWPARGADGHIAGQLGA